MYAEITPVTKVASKLLKELLWSLEEGLSYEDKSIFIEEKTLLVTNALLNAVKILVPVISRRICAALVSVLKATIEFLEGYPINSPSFKTDFRKMMIKEQTSGQFIRFLSKTDSINFRIFFAIIYSPLIY